MEDIILKRAEYNKCPICNKDVPLKTNKLTRYKGKLLLVCSKHHLEEDPNEGKQFLG